MLPPLAGRTSFHDVSHERCTINYDDEVLNLFEAQLKHSFTVFDAHHNLRRRGPRKPEVRQALVAINQRSDDITCHNNSLNDPTLHRLVSR